MAESESSMNIYSLHLGNFKLDGGAMFGVVPKSIWQRTNPADANNMCTWALRLMLIEDGKRLILVDTGMGDKQSEKFFSYYYMEGEHSLDKALAEHGFHRDDITDVFLTHMHFDHVGGSVRRRTDNPDLFEATFKNAVYWSNKYHWDWAENPNPREGYDVRPLLTLKEKAWVLNEAVEQKMKVFFEHDSQQEMCSLKATEKGARLDQILNLKDIS